MWSGAQHTSVILISQVTKHIYKHNYIVVIYHSLNIHNTFYGFPSTFHPLGIEADQGMLDHFTDQQTKAEKGQGTCSG